MNKFEEGDQVLVKAVIARSNDEMAVLEMTTNKGEPYTMVVRTSDVTHPTDDKVARIRAEIEVIRESYRSDCIKAGNEGFNNQHMSSGGSASACTRILEIIDKEGADNG